MAEEKKKKQNKDPTDTKTEEFDVIISETDDDTTVMTSIEEISERWILEAMNRYDVNKRIVSVHLNDSSGQTQRLTPELIDNLARNPQNDLKKILAINDMAREYVNKDDIIGKVVETIGSNVNTSHRLDNNLIKDAGRNTKIKHDEAKRLIKGVNDAIKLKSLIRRSITTTYTEGTWISFLRHNGESYVLDIYPLGVCEISDYEINGEPQVMFNINELKTRLAKTYKKDRKNKALFFQKIDDEIRANYPPEVYKAFKAKEAYAKLDIRYSGVLRIGEQNRKYGLTPIFRAFKALSLLEAFDSSDMINAKARGKKFIHQKLRKEVLGIDYSKKGFEEMSFAHANFMGAWQQPTVVVTTPASVEDITYVEPKVEMINKDKYNSARSRVLTTLGISFLMDSNTQSVSAANISLAQLLKTINMIAEQLETVLEKWYRQILIDKGIDVEYMPHITVLDSEQLEADMKRELSSFLFSTLGASYESSYAILGMSAKDEALKRKDEEKAGYAKIFAPHATAYTRSSKDDKKVGNPKDSTNPNKEEYDDEYNKLRE